MFSKRQEHFSSFSGVNRKVRDMDQILRQSPSRSKAKIHFQDVWIPVWKRVNAFIQPGQVMIEIVLGEIQFIRRFLVNENPAPGDLYRNDECHIEMIRSTRCRKHFQSTVPAWKRQLFRHVLCASRNILPLLCQTAVQNVRRAHPLRLVDFAPLACGTGYEYPISTRVLPSAQSFCICLPSSGAGSLFSLTGHWAEASSFPFERAHPRLPRLCVTVFGRCSF